MTSYEIEAWIQALARWFHVFAGILWIGQTYLFNFFEKHFEKPRDGSDATGSVWMVHGGGFFHVEKHKFRQDMPAKLHWFKWEAGLTWLSGVVLLVLVYYMGGILVDPDRDYTLGLIAAVGAILASWFLYDLAALSALGNREGIFAVLGFLLLLGIHAGLSELLSSRAAFFHVGAIMGTIMAGNVWIRIIPAQRKMLVRVEAGVDIEPGLLKQGPQRSRHNSFMVVPVVFIMISSHYPVTTYGHEQSTLILGILLLLGVAGAWVMRR